MLSFIDFICKRSKTINNTIWNTENTRENSVTVYKGTINIILSYFLNGGVLPKRQPFDRIHPFSIYEGNDDMG